MKKIIAICGLVMISAATSAFGLPILSSDTVAVKPLLNSSQEFNINLSESANLNSVTSVYREDSASENQYSNWYGDRQYSGWDPNSGWWNPQPIRYPAPTPGGNPSPVPEPATLLLIGVGLIGLAGISRKQLRN